MEKRMKVGNVLKYINQWKMKWRQKRAGHATIYYNPKWGYIIASETTLKDSVAWVTMNPVDTRKPDVAEKQLGEAILAALCKSRVAAPIERREIEGFKFWQVTGIKGFAAFSKKFQCVEVKENGDMLKLEKLKRESDGSYSWIKNEKGIELPMSCTEESIGQSVYHILHSNEGNI